MKKQSALIFLLFFFITSAFAQLKVSSNGYVGVNNNTPSYRLDVNGTFRVDDWTDIYLDKSGICCGTPTLYPENDWYLQIGKANKRIGTIFTYQGYAYSNWIYSDDSLKANKTAISSPVAKIQALTGWKFNYRDTVINAIPDSSKGNFTHDQYGFMAREVAGTIPELVTYDTVNNLYAVNYVGVLPILVEAVKSQQNAITSLNNTINDLQEQITTLSNELHQCCDSRFKKVEMENSTATRKMIKGDTQKMLPLGSFPILYQNSPNPFTDKTEIKYYLPEGIQNAKIIIYNLNGLQLNAFTLSGVGLQSIVINEGLLPAGS